MAKFANQKTVICKKEPLSVKDTFLQINNNDWALAARSIKQFNTFKLYLYFARHQDGFSLGFSPEHAQEMLGMGKTSCNDAFNALIGLGYIREIRKNVYEFYTIPYEEEESAIADEEELTATAEIIDIKTKSALADKKILTGTAENKNSALADNDSQKTGGNDDLTATAEQNFAKEWGF